MQYASAQEIHQTLPGTEEAALLPGVEMQVNPGAHDVL